MTSLKDKIAGRRKQTQEDSTKLAEDFSKKADDIRSDIGRIFDQSLRSQDEVRERCQVLGRALQRERQERNKLEEERHRQTEEKQQDLVKAVDSRTKEMHTDVESVNEKVGSHNKQLVESRDSFNTQLEKLSKASPEHYLKTAEEHRSTFIQKETSIRGELKSTGKKLRDTMSETETLRGAVARQLEDLCKRQETELKGRYDRVLVNLEARKDDLARQLEEARRRLGLAA